MTATTQTPQANPSGRRDIFGQVHLGYLVIESQRFTDWRRFAADAIGLHVDELTLDTMRYRLDDRACRFLVQRGPAEDVTAVGWQVDDHATFEDILGRVHAVGLPVAEGSAEECALRGVERLWRFPGPNGMDTEIFTRAETTQAPLRMLQSGFVTGDGGMGHIALTSGSPEKVRGYYDSLFDARLSDWINETISGLKMKVRFLRVNERHHTVAIANLKGIPGNPTRTSIQHLNTQVESLDDMLAAYERVLQHGFTMQWSVGQHSNDREFSFYCITPSGFEWEVGWDPIVVTPELEETWAPRTYDSISIWGHTQVGFPIVQRLNQLASLARTLGREDAALVTPWGRL